jgi:hypothetical protein
MFNNKADQVFKFICITLIITILRTIYLPVFNDTADHNPANWLRLDDDMFMPWPHGPARLQQFIWHLNSLRPTTKFSMEVKDNNTLLFLAILVVNNVKYLGVIFDRKITWGLHIKTIETKAFKTFIRTYSLFKSEHLSANIKLTLYKALIRSIISYASPTWEFAANTHLLKLQRLQNKVLRTIGNFPRRTPVRELYNAFNIPYIYDYITKLCGQ